MTACNAYGALWKLFQVHQRRRSSAYNTAKMSSRPELKVDDEVGFIKFFRHLAAKDEDTVRIFDRGDFYTAHGDDAVFIARTVCCTHHCVKNTQAD